MRKKLFLFTMASILSVAAVPVYADGEEHTMNIDYNARNDPTYNISIPAAITMDKEGTALEFEAADVENLQNEKVSVKIAGTDQYRNQMLLKNIDDGSSLMRYQIINDEGKVLETKGGKDEMVGEDVVAFTEDGVKTCEVKPVENTITALGHYSGAITFEISVEEK